MDLRIHGRSRRGIKVLVGGQWWRLAHREISITRQVVRIKEVRESREEKHNTALPMIIDESPELHLLDYSNSVFAQ